MSGLDPLAALFMAVSMGSVTALAGYCFWRVLTTPPPDPDGAGDADDETGPA